MKDTLFQHWKPVSSDIDEQVRKHVCFKGQCDKIFDPFLPKILYSIWVPDEHAKTVSHTLSCFAKYICVCVSVQSTTTRKSNYRCMLNY